MYETPINREYVRTDNWSVVAKTSKDKDAETWIDVLVPDVAAGGLLFLADVEYIIGDELWFELRIDPMTPGVYGTIRMVVRGAVRGDRGMRNEKHAYSVVFTEISDGDKIRLDELIRLTNFRYKVDSDPGTEIFNR